jgi:hypothetical protein
LNECVGAHEHLPPSLSSLKAAGSLKRADTLK